MTQQTLGTVDAAGTSGTALAALLTGFGQAIESSHKGPEEPVYKKAGLFWLDDAADPIWSLKFYDGTIWISVLSIDTGAGTINFTGSAAKVGDLSAGQFLRSDADTFLQAALEARFGIHGGFGTGGNAGSGTDWGAAMWALGKSYDGTGYGSSFDPGGQFYGTAWIRADHAAAIAEVGEGLYVYRNGEVVAAFGQNGVHLPTLGKYPPGFKQGYQLSLAAADPDHDVTVQPGGIRDSTGTDDIGGGLMTKRINANWGAGTNNGGRFSGSALQANTRYYFFAIKSDADQSVDYGYSVNANASDRPAGYSKYALLDQLRTNGSQNLINSMNGTFVSDEIPLVIGGEVQRYHGLPDRPRMVQIYLKCKVAIEGWGVGNEIPVNWGLQNNSVSEGFSAKVNDNLISGRFGGWASGIFSILNENTGAIAYAPPANFNMVIRATL